MPDTNMLPNAQQPSNSQGALQGGQVLRNRYKITGILGVGGMGSVYLARDLNFPAINRGVAVKEMINSVTDQAMRDVMMRNCEREANILAQLSHPAIPKIYDFLSENDRVYLIMEYINGKDMEAIINTMPDFLPFDMVKKWAIELCDVLHYLHIQQPEPIIFRDMKPSNVMIDSQGNVRLIDFGIARTFQSNQKGTMIGTEGYSPPEQYRGEASPAGDVYALGATLHHLLTRRDPRLEAPFSFHERQIRKINPKCPESFEKIVMRALDYHVAGRFPTAAAMKDAIINIDGPAVRSDASVSVKGVASNPADDTLDSALMIKALWKFKVEEEIRSTPIVYKGVVYFGAYDNNLYALNAQTGDFKWKFPTTGGIVSIPAIAEDDGLIVIGSEDGKVYAVDILSGKVRWSMKTDGPVRSSPTVAAGHVFIGSDDGKLYTFRVSSGNRMWTASFGAPVRSRPAVTSERIVVGVDNGDLMILDLQGAPKNRFKAKRAIYSNPLISDKIAYFGSMDTYVYGVDINSGWATWRVRTNKSVVGSAIVVDKVVYIGSADNNLYALDINSGRELWKFEAGGQIVSTPATHAGAIYFGCVDGKIYSIEMKKGKLRWTFDTEGPITSSPCIVDKTLYIGSTDKHLYAISI